MKRIEDFALIGDGETAALIDREATIAWLCMPRFDSPACFAAMLGDEENGCWRLAPIAPGASASRRYVGDSLVLETRFETPEGVVTVSDFMPIRGEAPDVVRIVEGVSGAVEMESSLALRFGYGRTSPLVRRRSETEVHAIAGANAVALHADHPILSAERRFTSRFTLAAGERASFVLTWFPSHEQPPSPCSPDVALIETRRWWESWVAKQTYEGPHRDLVVRSLITLKALIYRPTGAMVAAPTLGLPEWPGGERNWDYRYCWLRDATFTLLVLLQAGMKAEAEAWIAWLRRAVAGEPVDAQPLYTVTGEALIAEWEAPWLAGFGGAQPVRIGNAADKQLQLDIYGEVLDALYFAWRHGIDGERDARELAVLLLDELETVWREPDCGVWESRGPARRYTYSVVMCWVAFDRAARWLGADDEAVRKRFRDLADEVKAEVLAKGFNVEANTFTRAFGDTVLDASNLRLPLVGFLPADDPRVQGTVEAVERRLMQNGFVLRYRPDDMDDGVGGEEGAFLACTLWLADVYVLQGRQDEAADLLDRVCAIANDLGLLAEEVDTRDGSMLGNFPQALTHLAVIDTAMDLRRTGGPVQERSREGRVIN